MKKFLFFLCTAFTLLGFTSLKAQTYTIEKDTVRLTFSGTDLMYMRDSIVPLTGSSIIDWKIVSTNFPADWQAQTIGICDNNSCYPWSLLWPSGATKTSHLYSSTSGVRDFHLQLNIKDASTSGTYYIVVKLTNTTTLADTTQVYAVTFMPTAVPSVSKAIDEISLYPNPTNNDINVVYNANADVKTIAVYNIIGKVMAVYKVSGNSANLSLENVPAGIYFVRLVNSQGEVVVTRKFTKQ